MAILKRYDSLATFQDSNGDTYSSRYKRAAKNLLFFEIVLDKPMTLDYISVMQYGTPLLFWAIADINNITEPTTVIPAGTKLKVPQL